jgi:D-xylose transport system substrate-binding protein
MNGLSFRKAALQAIATVCLGLMLASVGGTGASGQAGGGTVTMLLPENVTARWEEQDRPFFAAAMKKYAPNVKVDIVNAVNDQSRQQSQAEAALTNGTRVLVVIPVDQVAAAAIVNDAHKSKVPVIAYDRLIKNSPVSYYVSVDGVDVGRLQGQWLVAHTKNGDNIAVINGSPTDDNAHLFNKGYMSVLQPLFNSGKRKQIANIWTPGWDPSKAQQEMEQILTQHSNKIQGILSANDGMAGGMIAALQAQGLAGKVPITGLDATLAADQRILRGTQSMTVWRSLREEADKAAQIAAALVKGQKPPASLFPGGKSVNNGMVNVPWAPLKPIVVDKTNMDLLIKDGSISRSQLCNGIPHGTGPC